jgi:phage gpG-like protein
MPFDFKVGRFTNARGLETAIEGVGNQVLKSADIQAARLKGAFVFGGHANRGGEQWAPWSARYAKQARKRGQRFVLLRTGAMRASIGARVIDLSGPNYTVAIESTPFYSEYMQNGTSTIPARPFLVMTTQDAQAFNNRMTVWLDKALNG